MPIQTIASDIELPVMKPANVEFVVGKARVFDLREFLDPIDATADTTPEAAGGFDRLGVHLLVTASLDLRCGRKALWNWLQALVHLVTLGRRARRTLGQRSQYVRSA